MKLVTYKYLFRTKSMLDEKTVGVRYVTDTEEAHLTLVEQIKADDETLSCFREYVNEYDCALLSQSESIKIAPVDYEGAKEVGIVEEVNQ